jgi:hypothetical protein
MIGSGTFGTVYIVHIDMIQAYWIDRGEDVAIKSIEKKLKYKNR